VQFSCFALPNSFLAVPWACDPFSCLALPHSFSSVPRASSSVFIFFAPGLVFVGTNGVGTNFHVLLFRTHFRQYRGRHVPFSCFALPDSFSAVPRASVIVFMFCVPDLVSTVLGASSPIFMFCAPELIFGGTVGVRYCFHVLRSRTRFRRYRGRRVQFSCFAFPDSFSTIKGSSGPVFMFCAPGLVFGGTEDAGSRFHVLRSRTRFRRYRVRRVPFLCFALPDSFSAVPRASGPVFIGTEGLETHIHVFRSRTSFGGTEDVRSIIYFQINTKES
jgi:hypothetical protein